MTLRLVMGVIHNPSDEWMSCTLKSNEHKMHVSPIPPRSTRPIPPTLENPEIVSETILSNHNISKFEASRTGATSSPVESIDLKIQGTWKGTITIGDLTENVIAIMAIKEKHVNGWFKFNNVIHFLTGTWNPLSKQIVFVHLSFEKPRTSSRLESINGQLQAQNGKYTFTAQCTDFAINIMTDVITSFENDTVLTGLYLGNYQRGQNMYEILAEITVTTNGLVSGRGNEQNGEFLITGIIDSENKKFSFVRTKGNEVMFYHGDTNFTARDVSLQGQWQIESQRGNFNMIKMATN